MRITAVRGRSIILSSSMAADRSGKYSVCTAFWRAMLEVEMRMGRGPCPLAARRRWNTAPAAS